MSTVVCQGCICTVRSAWSGVSKVSLIVTHYSMQIIINPAWYT